MSLKNMKTIVAKGLCILMCSIPLVSNAAELVGGRFNPQSSQLQLMIKYQGESLPHNFSLELDSVCDDFGSIAARVNDSGWEDTEIGPWNMVNMSFDMELPQCATSTIEIHMAPHSRLSVPVK